MFNINTSNGPIQLTTQEIKEELNGVQTRAEKGEFQGRSVTQLFKSKLGGITEKFSNMKHTVTKHLKSETEHDYRDDWGPSAETNLPSRKLQNLDAKELSSALKQIRKQISDMAQTDKTLNQFYKEAAKSFNTKVNKDIQVDTDVPLSKLDELSMRIKDSIKNKFSVDNEVINNKEDSEVISALNYLKSAFKNFNVEQMKANNYKIGLAIGENLRLLSTELNKTEGNGEQKDEVERLIYLIDEMQIVENAVRLNNLEKGVNLGAPDVYNSKRYGINPKRALENRVPVKLPEWAEKAINENKTPSISLDPIMAEKLLDDLKQRVDTFKLPKYKV